MQNFDNIAVFIPSAGLGTRLKPLTNDRPKALVEFMGKSMLEGVLERLYGIGIRKFCVNIHHFSELMRDEISRLNSKYDIIISDESDKLLDTGGGLVNAAKMLKACSTILVHNVDVFADINLESFIQYHIQNKHQISMAVSDRDTSRKLFFVNKLLRGWKNFKTDVHIGKYSDDNASYKAFSGIQMVDKEVILNHHPEEDKFPLIPWYIRICDKIKIHEWIHESSNWFDLGTTERILLAEKYLKKQG